MVTIKLCSGCNHPVHRAPCMATIRATKNECGCEVDSPAEVVEELMKAEQGG